MAKPATTETQISQLAQKLILQCGRWVTFCLANNAFGPENAPISREKSPLAFRCNLPFARYAAFVVKPDQVIRWRANASTLLFIGY
jgi:hypothetical protein